MDFCRLNACFGVSRSYCMGVLAFVWGTEAYNGEICDFFYENYAKISRIAKNELFMSFSPQQR